MKKKRVIKKVTPSVLYTVDHKMGMKDTKMEPLSVKELEKTGEQSQDINRSMSTVVTQLSNDSSNHSENFPSGSVRQSKNSFNSRTKRLPSEDCVPKRQYCEVV